MFFPESSVVIDASSLDGSDVNRRGAALGAYAVAALCDRGVPAQRIDLARFSRAALLDGFASDRVSAAVGAIRDAEFVALVADARSPHAFELSAAFAARVGTDALCRRPVLLVLASDDLARADGAARAYRNALVSAGARDVDVAILDLSRDGCEVDLEALLASRLAGAVSPAEAALSALAA